MKIRLAYKPQFVFIPFVWKFFTPLSYKKAAKILSQTNSQNNTPKEHLLLGRNLIFLVFNILSDSVIHHIFEKPYLHIDSVDKPFTFVPALSRTLTGGVRISRYLY